MSARPVIPLVASNSAALDVCLRFERYPARLFRARAALTDRLSRRPLIEIDVDDLWHS
jgi:hypothetical protein